MKQLGAIQNQAAEEEAKLVAELKILDGKIRNLKLVFARKVDESDSMFGSVSELDIVNELAAQGIEVHKSAVQLDKHIKDLGEITVPIRLHREIMSELVVTVEKEGGEVPSEPAVVETIVEEEPAPAPETEQEPAAPEVEEPTAEEAADTQENEQVEIQPEQEL